MSLHCLAEFCRLASIALSIISAYYWYKASKAKVTEPDNSIGIEQRYPDPENKDKLIHVLATAKKQSELNAVAAKFIAWAIAFQAAALVLDSF